MTYTDTGAPPLVTIVLALVLAAAVLGAGVAKLAGAAAMRQVASHLGFSWPAYRRIGVLEVAGAAGVVAGIVVPLLGALAAGCLAVLLVLAAAAHLRRGDRLPEAAPAAALAALAAVVAVLMVRAA